MSDVLFQTAVQHHLAGRLPEAEAIYRQILEQNPNHFDALHMLGVIAHQVGRNDVALDLIRRAIAIKPDFAEAYSNLGLSLNDAGQLDEAIASYRAAIEFKPDYAAAYNNLGNVLKDKGQLDAAIESYRQAIALQPDFTGAHSNLVLVHYYHPGFDSTAILREARRFDARHAASLTNAAMPHANDPDPLRRLRIGYVSHDFYDHPVGRFAIRLLECHDHNRFEVFCYAGSPQTDAVTKRFMRCVDAWRTTNGQGDDELSHIVRSDRIDILVDLSMHTAGGRPLLFARKPAPIQVAYLAYPGTTGLSAMEYRISDPWLDPPGIGDELYSEKTVRLETFWCYDPMTTPPELIAQVLAQVGESRLLMLCPEGESRATIVKKFAELGIAAGRIEFVPFQSRPDYLRTFNRIDISLDTLPYNGHTTSMDSLWMGVPPVTLAGKTVVGRAGVSMLSNVGLPEWIARTPEQYAAIARDWAADLPRLAELRGRLRNMMQKSVLMDAPRCAAGMEAAYRQMWIDWCKAKS